LKSIQCELNPNRFSHRKQNSKKTKAKITSETAAPKRNKNTSYSEADPAKPWTMYDNSFADKQCEAYTKWLNFVLKPNSENHNNNSTHNHTIQHSNVEPQSLTLKYMLIERKRVQTTQKALTFYHGVEMTKIRNSIEQEIISKRLSMRSDHDVLANVNLKSQMMSLIMSYSVPWLKLGLETIFHEPITLDIVNGPRKKDLLIRKSLGIASPKVKSVSC
jgi:hypothetical protein